MPQLKPQNITGYYAVIRHSSDGYDYVDILTLSGSSEASIESAKETDKRLPLWEHDNKIVGLAAVDLMVTRAEEVSR